MSVSWRCPKCESEVQWKGLCRDCTEYDDMGIPIAPVARVKVGDVHQCSPSCNHVQSIPTKELFLNNRRRKLTKKQVKVIEEIAKAKALIPTVKKGEEFIEVGEMLGEEE